MRSHPSLIAAAALLATAAQAATGTLQGLLDAGPLAGTTFTGSYSYDDSGLTGATFEQIALTGFSLTLLSDVFSLNTSATADFGSGVFLGLSYTDARTSYTLTLSSGSVDASDAFVHYQPTTGLESSGGYTVSAVPEPASYALLIGGLCSLSLMARRRQR